MTIALVTMALTPDRVRLGEDLTFPRMREYAERYGMDFVVIDQCKRDLKLGDVFDWERNDALYDLLGHYQKILHLEDDVVVRRDAQDVSSLPPNAFYGFDNAPWLAEHFPLEVQRCWIQARETWTEFQDVDIPMQHLFNNGMFLVDRSHRELFAPASVEPCNVNSDPIKSSHWKGMGLMNARLHRLQMPVEHRPDLFGLSYLQPKPMPSFLHILWYDEPKREGVEKFIKEMDSDV